MLQLELFKRQLKENNRRKKIEKQIKKQNNRRFQKDKDTKQISTIQEISGVSQSKPDITKINKPMLVYRPTVNIKLIILLIENTQELIEQKKEYKKL